MITQVHSSLYHPQNIASKEMKVKNDQASETKSTKPEPKKELTKEECKEAIEKLPAIFENIEDLTKMAYSFGSISKEDHDKTMSEIAKAKAKDTKPTLSECLTDYKEDETDRELVQCLTNTSEISGFACLKHTQKIKQAPT